ncbi:MAG: hypothetical protein KGI75_04200 [Rhizobiaceae bacterium]|nr:hypothetical protein [Rhizobiaceae bacterium]
MADVRIIELPTEGAPTVAHELAIDLAETRKITIGTVGDVARPFASQAEAEAGIDNTKTMTPLTSAQQLAARGPTLFASAAEGALAGTALQPDDVAALAFKDKVAIGDIDASGSTTSTTFLAGNGTWVFLPGGGNMLSSVYDPNGAAAPVMFRSLNLSDLSDVGTAQDNIQSGATFADRQSAAAASIAARNKTLHTQVFATSSIASGGGGRHKRISLADLTGVPSRAYFRSQDRFMPDGTTDATNGGYWVLDEEQPSVAMFGAVSGDTAGNLLSAFQAAIDYLPSGGGIITIPNGDFSALNPSSLNVGFKAVNYDCRSRTLPDTTLPANLPGAVDRNGRILLPETSIQDDRYSRVHNYIDMGNTLANQATRQYGIHVVGFMADDGTSDIREMRGYSYDVGTNSQLAPGSQSVRGIKGRAYGDGGQSNIRSGYFFAEGVKGSGFHGLLTGMLATLYQNDTSPTEAIGVRSHIDNGCTAGYEAAGAIDGQTGTVGFGFRTRPGTIGVGQPLVAATAHFAASGEGSGDLFLGFLGDGTTASQATAPFRALKGGATKARSLWTDRVTIADDAVYTIPAHPNRNNGGFILITCENTQNACGLGHYTTSSMIKIGGGTLFDVTTGVLTGTTGVDGHLTTSPQANGSLMVENRTGATRSVWWQIFGPGA